MSNEPEPAISEGNGPDLAPVPVRRLFFAWQADEVTRERLLEWQLRLGRSRQLDDGVRWLNPEQLHVTLLFMGEVAAGQSDSLIAAAAAAADDLVRRGVRPCIELDRLAFFPRRSRPRVLVLAGRADEATKEWHRALRQAVAGFLPADERPLPLKPHVTLGRVTSHKAAGAKLARVREPIVWPSVPLSLMESRLQPGGSAHLAVWSHGPAAAPPTDLTRGRN